MLTILFGLLSAAVALAFGYAVIAGRPAITEERNRLRVPGQVWSASGVAATAGGIGELAGFWSAAIGIIAAFALIALAAGVIWFQQQGGDRLHRSLPPAAFGVCTLLYAIFLLVR